MSNAVVVPKTHKSLYAKKITAKTMDKIDKIVKDTAVSKWMVIDKILSQALGIKTKNKLDLRNYLKGCK